MSLTSGQKLGRYEIISALGAGGMSETPASNRTVAIKVLPEP